MGKENGLRRTASAARDLLFPPRCIGCGDLLEPFAKSPTVFCPLCRTAWETAVTEADISRAVYTVESGDPDMIVRTGGDMRISNFMLWQCAYSEFYFTDTLWPDMTSKDIDLAVKEFYSRQRRYGKV